MLRARNAFKARRLINLRPLFVGLYRNIPRFAFCSSLVAALAGNGTQKINLLPFRWTAYVSEFLARWYAHFASQFLFFSSSDQRVEIYHAIHSFWSGAEQQRNSEWPELLSRSLSWKSHKPKRNEVSESTFRDSWRPIVLWLLGRNATENKNEICLSYRCEFLA